MKEIVKFYLFLLEYPNSPKAYRQLRDLYHKLNRPHEAQAFNTLLEHRYAHLSSSDQKPCLPSPPNPG